MKIDLKALEALPEAEQARVREELRIVEEAYRENPLLGFVPHAKQVEFLRPEADGSFPPLRAFFGGNRSGKTTAAIVDTILQCVDREVLPDPLRPFKRWDPPVRIRVVTPDLTSTMDGVIHEKLREWCPRGQFKGESFDRAFDKQQRMLHFKNGSWIQFNSSEQDREKLGGVALHRVVYDEEPRLEVRRECLTRLIDYDGEEIFALTPFSGMAWLFDEVYDPWERGELDPADGRVVVVDMDDNPHLSESGKARALAQYSGPEREARKSGRFVSFSGLIYPQAQGQAHIIPQIERVPPGVEVFRGIDPGYRHMCAVVYCYLDSDDTLVQFDEIALKQATVKEVCQEIQRRDVRWGFVKDDGTRVPLRVNWSVIDPASKNRNNQTGRSDQSEFWDNGVSTIPGQNAVGAGINRVKERLDADKLKVTANCSETLNQFRRYRWVKDDGRGEDEAREKPVKKDDHCFPAGTLITTATGWRRIEDMRVGDLVATRDGLFPVLLAGKTSDRSWTTELVLEDGRSLTGTPNHLVYVAGEGWTPLDDVRYGDTMWVWAGDKKSSGMESGSTDTQTPSTPGRETTSPQHPCGCTGPCGNPTMDPSRQDTTSTTSTATQQTTTSPTWSVWPPPSMPTDIGQTNAASTRDGGWSKWCDRQRRLGINQTMAGHGIASTPDDCLPSVNPFPLYAKSAAPSLKALNVATSAFAQALANPPGGAIAALMTRIVNARGAGNRIEQIGTQKPELVPLRVAARLPAKSEPVYNLTVLGPPEYFANGVLVHNCLDALRYVVMQRPLAPKERIPKESEGMKQRLLRHALKQLRVPRVPDHPAGPGIFR